jgi:hypothetical protein
MGNFFPGPVHLVLYGFFFFFFNINALSSPVIRHLPSECFKEQTPSIETLLYRWIPTLSEKM